MTDRLRTKILDAAREEIHRFMDFGYRERRMLEEGDFASLEQTLERRARSLRRNAWWTLVGFPPFLFIVGWSFLRDLIEVDSRPTFIIRLLIILACVAIVTGTFTKLGLAQITRTERCLAYFRILAERDGDDSEKRPETAVRS